MKYYQVPLILNTENNVQSLDMNYEDAVDFHILGNGHGCAVFSDTYTPKSSWTEITESDYQNYLAPTLDQVKVSKISELNAAYQVAFTTFQSSALSTSTTTVTKNYPINQESQDNLKDLQSRLIADPSLDEFPFLTMEDRILVDHTRTQFLQLLRDASTRIKDLHNQNRTYANKIADATDITTLQTITFTFN